MASANLDGVHRVRWLAVGPMMRRVFIPPAKENRRPVDDVDGGVAERDERAGPKQDVTVFVGRDYGGDTGRIAKRLPCRLAILLEEIVRDASLVDGGFFLVQRSDDTIDLIRSEA